MYTKAKQWWENSLLAKYLPAPMSIPGKGWTIWQNNCKLAMFNCEVFNLHIQSHYFKCYWEQPNKLGNLYSTIEWKACGISQKQFLYL